MKYARVFLKGSDNPLRWVDVPLNTGTFGGFCSTVRMQGAIMPMEGWAVWLPFDEIKYMVEIETGTPTPPGFFFEAAGKPN